MHLIYITLSLLCTYLATLAPEFYLKVSYIGVVAFSSFQLGASIKETQYKQYMELLAAHMAQEYQQKLNKFVKVNNNDLL